jgi:hypothetical protein
MLLRPPYAGAKYTSLFQTIQKQDLHSGFGNEVPTGAYKSYSRNHSKTGCDKRRIVEIKRSFNTYNFANPLKRKQLALITERFCPYMEPLCHVSRGETREVDTGKTDYRYH